LYNVFANFKPRYQHYSWVYAFRFLRASQSLDLGTLAESHAAIENLQIVATLAHQQNDHDIIVVSYLLEAIAHLRSNGDDAIVGAQRAISAVRQYQMDGSKQIPQLLGLAHIIDVICSIRQNVPRVMQEKIKKMQDFMDRSLKDPTSSWSNTSDRVAIPINRTQNSSQYVSSDTRMIIGIGDDGRDNLMLSFLNMKDAYALA